MRWVSTGRSAASRVHPKRQWRPHPRRPVARPRRRPPPDPVEIARAEEDDMLAEAAAEPSESMPRRDPEEVALELLQNELGARRIDG